KDIHFPADNSGYAVSDFGEILYTADGGATWQNQNSGVSVSLNCVLMTDPNAGYIAGDLGIILKRDVLSVSGSISEDTTWDAMLIQIVGDVTIESGVTLTIEPGVDVVIEGDYRISAAGVIDASGSQDDQIAFSGTETGISWDRIRLENEDEASTFTHCRISGAEIGIASVNSPVSISNCIFSDNQKAIEVFAVGSGDPAEVQINTCLIENCQQNGIFVVENSNTTITNCQITQCALDESPRGAIQLSNQSANGNCSPVISDNWIHHNVWQGLTAFDITGNGNIAPQVENNIIEYNLTGVYLLYASGTFHNNQIRHNFVPGNTNSGAGMMISGANSAPLLTENILTGNFTGFYFTDNASANLGDLTNDFPGDDGRNQIYDNIDLYNHPWSIYIEDGSSTDIMAENNTWDSEDYEEIAFTIWDGNDVAGLGFVDFDPIFVEDVAIEEGNNPLISVETALTGCYPNPYFLNPAKAIPHLTFAFVIGGLEADQPVRLAVYNLTGQIVKTVLNNKLPGGEHHISWDGNNENNQIVPAGLYFYQLTIGDKNFIQKVAIIK
ncbi:MAG: hypothetical protein GY869_29220, partial [Planctomycetes bacterium]|nr:hypothetical protein [Planctomycetota bacterium]